MLQVFQEAEMRNVGTRSHTAPMAYGQRLASPPPNYGPPRPGRECKFCKNNGETSSLYRSHVLRNPATGQLVCPILRAHVCEICGGTQDDAHTR